MAKDIVTVDSLRSALEIRNGEYRIDHRIVAEGLGYINTAERKSATDWRRNVLEKHESSLLSFGEIPKTTMGNGAIVWYLNESQVVFALNCSRRGVSSAFCLEAKEYGIDVSMFCKRPRNRAKVSEKSYSDDLAKKLNGLREVKTLAGNIDVLTSEEIIEVKLVSSWKAALGQVLVYGHYYPSHQQRIHLYGETQDSFLAMIKNHCYQLGVKMTWEP